MALKKTKLSELFDYWLRIRDYYDLAVKLIPEEKIEWKPKHAPNSFGDILRHTVETTNWGLAAVGGNPHQFKRCKKSEFATKNSLITALEKSRLQLFTMLANKYSDDLNEPVMLSSGNEATLKWLLFHLMEHDVHHRCQVFIYLRLLGINPPKI
ncbi:MAG: hypothetical protein GF307_10125 [candidate division Zixibacteria bacterium]|nr:hypothetical protein [candidate division Zixibacteria bacterium]